MKDQPSLPSPPGGQARVLRCFALAALAWGALAARAFAADYNVTTNGNAIVVTDVAGHGDTLDVSEPSAGNIRFAAAGRTFSVNGGGSIAGDSGILSRSGMTLITVNAGAGADAINVGAFTGTLPSLTLNGGTGDDTVDLHGDITFAVGANLNVDLQNDDAMPGVDRVNVSGNLLVSGTGSITVKCSRDVSVNGGASLQTTNGNLVVEANQQVVATVGNFIGVNIGGGLLRCTGTGQIIAKGRGGDDAGGGQLGILVVGGGQIIGGSSGVVTVVGTGGASTNWINRGVTVYGSNALVSSMGGPVQVTGQGGSVGSYYGIGVSLLFGGVIRAGGSGTVTVTGTGAGGGGANQGIEMSEPGTAIASAGGAIQVTGIPGPGGFGITAANQCSIINTNGGDSIRLISDSIAIANNVVIAAGGNITLKPKNNDTLINLGGGDSAGTLGLTDAELDRITAATIIVGDSNSGSITISAAISPTNAATLSLISGGVIGDTYNGSPDITVTNLLTSGNLSPGASPGVFSVAGNETMAAHSVFTVEIGGTTAGAQHDQVSATGSVTIGTNVTLNLVDFGGFNPTVGQTITIISRNGGSGTFAGLAEGAIIGNFLGSALGASITYVGGTGDDVVLTVKPPLTNNLIGYWNFDEGAGTTALDRSGYTNHGALRNFPGDNSQWVAGQIGGALRFSGPASSNWVYVANYLKPTTTMTFSAWVWADSRPTWASVAKNWGSGTGGQFHLGLDSTSGRLSNYQLESDLGAFNTIEGPQLPVASWQHVAFVCDGSMGRLYRNGVQVSSVPYDGTIRNPPIVSLALGCKTGENGLAPDAANPGFWHGRMDDVALWNRGLAPAEIQAIFAAGANGRALAVAAVGAEPPSILTQPVGTNAPPGSNVTLCVTATGSPEPSYQWRRNGVNIPGATASCFNLLAAQAADGGTFDVVISNPSGAIVSSPVSVVITVPVLPPGDNLANRVPLPGTNGTVRASNLNATREANEPMHVGKPGGRSVWYSFTAPAGGIMSIDTAGSSFDTLLAVYTGTTLLTLVEVASDEESGGALTSAVRFNVTAGVQYVIAVDGYGGVMGDFVLSWNFQPTAQFYPAILTQPASITVPPGANHTFAVSAFGTGLTFQWFFNGNPVPGATTNSLTITNVQESSLGTYLVRLTQGPRSLDSRPVSLQINLTDGFTQPVQATDKFLDASLLANPIILGDAESAPAPFAPPPASVVRGYTGTQIFNTFGAVNAVGEPPICGVRGGSSTWIKLLSEQTGELHLDTDGSSFDTVVEVFERIVGVTNLHSLGCDNNNGIDHLDSALVVPVVAGRTNFIEIDGVNGATGVLKFNYNLVVPSRLTSMGKNASGQYRFLVTGKPGMAFTIQQAGNLRTWTNLFSGTDADGSYIYTDTSPTPVAGRFYRLRMNP